MSLGDCQQTTKKSPYLEKLITLITTGPQTSLQNNKNMDSKNTLHLIESRPQRLKAVHKYTNVNTRYFSEQQPNYTAIFYARKNLYCSQLAPMLEKPHSQESLQTLESLHSLAYLPTLE